MAFTDAADSGPQGADQPQGGPPDQGGAPGGPPGGGALPFLRRGAQPSAPGPGDQASAMTQIQNAVSMLQAALPSLPQGSPIHTSVLRAVQQLSRHMAQGQPTAGAQQTAMGDTIRNMLRNALLSKIMQSQQQKPGGEGMMPPPPMPSTPLPGA